MLDTEGITRLAFSTLALPNTPFLLLAFIYLGRFSAHFFF
jgi:uncharacterized membrane protein YbaN (DUF454 family)